MSTDRREYAAGTSIVQRYPWGTYVGGRVLCADGTVRALARIAETADTFFSVPAAVKVRGRTVSGYVTVATLSGSSVETADDPAAALFIAYSYGRNADALPPGAYRGPAPERPGVWAIVHGGHSYAVPTPADAERFDSVAHVARVLQSRYSGADRGWPAVDASATAHVFTGRHPETYRDPYPDRVVTIGPRGGVRVARA